MTGVSSGIGRAIVERFSGEAGYRVYGTTRQVVPSVKPSSYFLIQMDPADTESVKKAIGEVARREGRVDLLVNNAGYMVLGSVESIDIDKELAPMFNVNVLGYLRTTQAVVPFMRKAGGGTIINISSVQAFEPRALQESYSATRAAVEALSLGQNSYLKDYGIKVLVFEPGATRSNVVHGARVGSLAVSEDQAASHVASFVEKMGRRIESGEPAESVAEKVFLLSRKVQPDFRTQAGEKEVRRALAVYRDPTGNRLAGFLREKYRDFVSGVMR
ncbi:MAG: SDR family NAD(P)-dependent oxidoreductase [Endozoicomonas sp.]